MFHLFGVDYEFHHDIRLLNRTAFLHMYLNDATGGAEVFNEWICGDLYEPTSKKFGVCPFPSNSPFE